MNSKEIKYFYLKKHKLTIRLQRNINTTPGCENQDPLSRMERRPVALTHKILREQEVCCVLHLSQCHTLPVLHRWAAWFTDIMSFNHQDSLIAEEKEKLTF